MNITFFTILLFFLSAPLLSADTASTQNKNITILSGQISGDGKSEVREQLLEECITGLPKIQDLEAVVSSDAKFLKEIGGDPARNDFLKNYSAVIDINYMIYRKVLFIVTTNAVPAREPVMKEMEKKIRESKRFESDANNGDQYAGRSRREYFFSTPEGAVADARKKAETWLKQQSAVICKQALAK